MKMVNRTPLNDYIEGVGGEVLIALIVGILIIMITWIFLFRRQHPNIVIIDNNPPPIFNPGYCPICLNAPSLAIETNCGHLHCGECFMLYHGRQFSLSLRNPVPCSICRQRVGLLFPCFSQDELTLPEHEFDTQRISDFVLGYNRMMTNNMSMFERLREIPILLRHFFNQLIYGLLPPELQWRIFVFLFLLLLYVVFPYDVIPDGYVVIGLMDDIFLVIAFLVFCSLCYRGIITGDQ